MRNSCVWQIFVVILLMVLLTGCGGSKEQEEKNLQLQNETNKLKDQIAQSEKHWERLSEKLAEVVGTVDPILLKDLFLKKNETGTVLNELDVLAADDATKMTLNIDDAELILRIKKFQGEFLFRSWIDEVADRNVITVQHLKSTAPVVPGNFDIAVTLWNETRETVEKKIAAGTMNELQLQDTKINFINKMRDIDARYKEQASDLFPQYLRENSYEKPQMDSDYLLNGQFRTGGVHTISFQVTPVDKDNPWAVIVELVRKSQEGEQVLKSFEMNPEIYQTTYKDSFTVLVKNKDAMQ